ncbi:glycosyltransferase family 4 protein [Rubinisphaera margarita]|uniref:glycosyltransferase family 4 protein n=1 Tax=Rubinisphaera margarita TaxID=2909586 RepID=UPI001EE7F127|nr:glycosyltransferase family 4 protein [Rubinisphaera margarita]MCG6157699.1 glycosyltransferase family 4 protein [Rubinisphaera margarita]
MAAHTLAFVSLPAWPVVHPESAGIFGGTETRAVTLARGLASRSNFDVCFLVRHPDLIQPQSIDGITFESWRDPVTERNARVAEALKEKRWSPALLRDAAGILLHRVFQPRGNTPLRTDPVLQKTAADLFCVFGVHSAAAKVIYNAHQTQRKAVLFLGSDADVDPQYASPGSFRTQYGERSPVCRWVLENADAVIVQNENQLQSLKEHFHREGELLRNPIDVADWRARVESATAPERTSDRYVLWIGRADDFHKRANIALDIAKKLPDINFVMILNPQQPEVEQRIREGCPANLQIISHVPFSQMPALYRNAALLLNTSSSQHEGLPNTFLQAGASRVPIVSLEVDAGYLSKSGGGVVGTGEVDKTVDAVQQLWSSAELRQQHGQSGHDYVAQHHDVPVVIDQLVEFLGRLG